VIGGASISQGSFRDRKGGGKVYFVRHKGKADVWIEPEKREGVGYVGWEIGEAGW